MGRSHRPIPDRLGEKLYFIRRRFKLTQQQMYERLRLGLDKDIDPVKLYVSHISEYEREAREPPLRILLEYARIARLPLEVLADTWMHLPGDYTHIMVFDDSHTIRKIDGTLRNPEGVSKHHKKQLQNNRRTRK